jgi:hypothetical protein
MLILWLGQSAPPSLYTQVFGIQGAPQDTSGEWANVVGNCIEGRL